jgi:hypothetical protein
MSNGTSLEYWIKHEVGINVNITSFEKQFSNGYYFGQIFYQYLLNPEFKTTFANRTQKVYRTRNYQQLKPLFTMFIGTELNNDMVKNL